jgi:UDP-glucose 4-epimerase
MSTEPVLVIGGSGLVGSSIVSALKRADVAARVDWTSTAAASRDLQQCFRKLLWEAEQHGRWTVYWAAGRSVISSDPDLIRREQNVYRSAITSLLEMSGESNGLIVITASAGTLYRGSPGEVSTESTTPEPTSSYGEMKLDQENFLRAALGDGSTTGLALRIASVYGCRQDLTKQQGLISALIRSARDQRLVTVYVPRETRRHYISALDVGLASTRIPETLDGEGFHTRLVYSERSRTIVEAVEVVRRVCGKKPVVQYLSVNRVEGHGFDLTLRTHHEDAAWRQNFTSLESGVHRIWMNCSGS